LRSGLQWTCTFSSAIRSERSSIGDEIDELFSFHKRIQENPHSGTFHSLTIMTQLASRAPLLPRVDGANLDLA